MRIITFDATPFSCGATRALAVKSFELLGGCSRKLANVKKNPSRVRFAHRSDVHEIVVLLSLGLLVLWTIGPFAVFVVYHVPPLRRFLGLDDSIK
jgi:hypothetical protein